MALAKKTPVTKEAEKDVTITSKNLKERLIASLSEVFTKIPEGKVKDCVAYALKHQATAPLDELKTLIKDVQALFTAPAIEPQAVPRQKPKATPAPEPDTDDTDDTSTPPAKPQRAHSRQKPTTKPTKPKADTTPTKEPAKKKNEEEASRLTMDEAFPTEIVSDGVTYERKDEWLFDDFVEAAKDDKRVLIARHWWKSANEDYYSTIYEVDAIELENDLDLLAPLHICETMDRVVVLSILTEGVDIFDKKDFDDDRRVVIGYGYKARNKHELVFELYVEKEEVKAKRRK